AAHAPARSDTARTCLTLAVPTRPSLTACTFRQGALPHGHASRSADTLRSPPPCPTAQDSVMTAAFYVFGAVAVAATILTITRVNAMRALLYLVVSLLAVAAIFFVLGAPFAAMLEIIVYAGAIMVLFVFAVMMLNLGEVTIEQERRWLWPQLWIGPGILSAILLIELVYLLAIGELGPPPG